MKKIIILTLLGLSLAGCVNIYKFDGSSNNVITHAGLMRVPLNHATK